MLKRMFGAAAFCAAVLSAVLVTCSGGVVAATLGQPESGQLGLQAAGSAEMQHLSNLYDMVNLIIIAIALFVLALLLYVMYRFSETRNPTPSRTTHNTLLEVAWTIIPILILVVISIPSFKLLFEQYSFPKPDLTVKATANAWFWDHEYMDQKVTITSNGISDEDLLQNKLGDKEFNARYGALEGAARHSAVYNDVMPVYAERKLVRRLSVDQEIAVPVNKVVHMLVTSNDVIHQWAMPGFGAKIQAVPGRTSALWFKADKVGTYHGGCAVLCGKLHSNMPIVIRVVEQPVYDSWMAALKAKDKKKAAEILKAEDDKPKSSNVAQAQ